MVKKLVILLFVGVLVQSGRGATAQELLVPPTGTPTSGIPSMELPEMPAVGDGLVHPGFQGESSAPIMGEDFHPVLEPIPADQALQVFDCQPALLESSGTWLRRGFWSAEVDAVMMDRVWRRDNFLLVFQVTEGNEGLNSESSNKLYVNAGRAGAEVLPRLTLDRFLFRDHKNRDHNLQFVAYGGGQWSQDGRLDAVNDGTLEMGAYHNIEIAAALQRFRFPLDNGNASFDGATSLLYSYDSRFNNFELNYEVNSRMRRDRMEMEPSGEWVRRAQNSPSFSLIAGIRYFDLNEDFDMNAFGIDADNDDATDPETGTYKIRTDNDLIGVQLGGSWTFETARWSLGLRSKSGMYLNHIDVLNQFEVTGGVTSGDNEVTLDNLSFLVEGGVIGKWHLRPNFSLRSGLEIMYVSSVALAAEQINFIPVTTAIVDNGSATYMGGSVGFEAYW